MQNAGALNENIFVWLANHRIILAQSGDDVLTDILASYLCLANRNPLLVPFFGGGDFARDQRHHIDDWTGDLIQYTSWC